MQFVGFQVIYLCTEVNNPKLRKKRACTVGIAAKSECPTPLAMLLLTDHSSPPLFKGSLLPPLNLDEAYEKLLLVMALFRPCGRFSACSAGSEDAVAVSAADPDRYRWMGNPGGLQMGQRGRRRDVHYHFHFRPGER